ncbi:hypothetical protein IT407_02960 [Candidatus Uhrbacteria bacterium]|nr:hypothetical protein [Candidatus Uhrbacteria bacterium]
MQPTGSDIGKAVSFNTIASWAAKIGHFAAALMIFRLVDPAAYGEWRLILAAWALVQGWLASAVSVINVEYIRTHAEGDQAGFDGKAAFAGYAKIVALVSTLFAIGCLLAPEMVSRIVGADDLFLIRLISAYFFLYIPRAIGAAWMPMAFAFGRSLIVTTVETFSYVAGLLIFLVWQGQGVVGIAYAQILSTVFGVICIAYLFPDLRKAIPFHKTGAQIKALFRIIRQHGKWAVATDALKDALDAARYRWLSFAIGNEAVGLFGLAESLLGHVVSLVSAGAPIASMIPRFVKDRERLIGTMKRASRVGTAVSAGLFLFGWVFVPIFIPVLFPKYIPSLPLYLGISPVVLVSGFGLVINAVYPALRFQKPLFLMLSIRAILSLSILYLFIPIFGISTLAIEFLTGSLVFLGMRWMYLRGKLGEKLLLRDFLIPKKQDLLDIWTFVWNRVRGLKSNIYERIA